MDYLESEVALEALYGVPAEAARVKVARRMTPLYREWIGRARFCVLTTVGPGGTDASPRGDAGPVVLELDPGTLALPDWRGNERLDSLRNIVRDGRVSLMFLVPGAGNVVRVNGRGRVTADEGLRARFARDGTLPRTVVVVELGEVYFQCARAVVRAGLWDGAAAEGLPTAGDFLREMTEGRFDGAAYDADWPERAARTLW